MWITSSCIRCCYNGGIYKKPWGVRIRTYLPNVFIFISGIVNFLQFSDKQHKFEVKKNNFEIRCATKLTTLLMIKMNIYIASIKYTFNTNIHKDYKHQVINRWCGEGKVFSTKKLMNSIVMKGWLFCEGLGACWTKRMNLNNRLFVLKSKCLINQNCTDDRFVVEMKIEHKTDRVFDSVLHICGFALSYFGEEFYIEVKCRLEFFSLETG